MRREASGAEMARIFRAVSSPIRLAIIEALNTSHMSFSELTKYMEMDERGDVGKFTYHLKTLIRTGLIEYSKETRTYSLTPLGKNMVVMMQGLYRRTLSTSLNAQSWDYFAEPIHRNAIANYLAESLRISSDLARRVGVFVEKRLEELRLDLVPRWLIEDLVRVELIFNNVGLEKLSGITPQGPPLHTAHRVFQNSVEKGRLEIFNRHIFETTMHRLVVERILPRELRKKYLSGEIDIHHAAFTPTHILSLSLSDLDEEILSNFSGAVVGDMTIRTGLENKPRLAPDPYSGLPEDFFLAIDIAPGNAVEFQSGELNDNRLEKVLRRYVFVDKLKVGLPLRKSAPLLYTLDEHEDTLFTRYAIKRSVLDVLGIHSIIGLNMLRLLGGSGNGEKTLPEYAKLSLELAGKYVERCVHLFYRFRRDAPKTQLHYLLAPVGLAEAQSLLADKSSKDRDHKEMINLVRSLLEIADNVAPLRGGVLLATAWPRRISDRLYSIDKALLAAPAPLHRLSSEMTNNYTNSLQDLLISMDLDELRELTVILGGMVLEEAVVEKLMENYGSEQVIDFLQSHPVLVSIQE